VRYDPWMTEEQDTVTDRQALKTIFGRVGIVYEENDDPGELPTGYESRLPYNSVLTVTQGAGPLNQGYTDFLTTFFFDAAGTLLCMGAWE
jgi:hypothetical protein